MVNFAHTNPDDDDGDEDPDPHFDPSSLVDSSGRSSRRDTGLAKTCAWSERHWENDGSHK